MPFYSCIAALCLQLVAVAVVNIHGGVNTLIYKHRIESVYDAPNEKASALEAVRTSSAPS